MRPNVRPKATKFIEPKARRPAGGSAGAGRYAASAAAHNAKENWQGRKRRKHGNAKNSSGSRSRSAILIRAYAAMGKIRSNLGNVYKTRKAAQGFARGRPVRKVRGGFKIMARRKRRRKSGRKTYKKKTTARRAAKGRSVYKVKGGWRISRARKRRR